MSLNSVLYTLIKASIGSETLVFSDQNSPRPNLPYWTIRVSSVRDVGVDGYGQGVDNSGNQKVLGVREATIQLQRIGVDSVSACSDIRDSLAKTTVRNAWQVAKIALFDFGPVLNVPYKMDNDYLEPRASIDLFVRVGTELVDNVGVIENVEIQSEYVSNQGLDLNQVDVDLSETINVVL